MPESGRGGKGACTGSQWFSIHLFLFVYQNKKIRMFCICSIVSEYDTILLLFCFIKMEKLKQWEVELFPDHFLLS